VSRFLRATIVCTSRNREWDITVIGHQLHEMRERNGQSTAQVRRALQHANMRATTHTVRVACRKCLTFACECVSMHVMEHRNAAVARGEKGSPTGFGAWSRTERTTFDDRNVQIVEVIEIAASEGMKFTAGAGFTSAVN
jgi:nucleoid DNA-binding protein